MEVTYGRVCSWENLSLAHTRAARGKRGKPAAAWDRQRVGHGPPPAWHYARLVLPTGPAWPASSLDSFDHFVKRELRCPGYVRYVDDFLLFGNSKRALWEWRDSIVERLKAYRSGKIQHPQMTPIASGLSDADIANVADWYAGITVEVLDFN